MGERSVVNVTAWPHTQPARCQQNANSYVAPLMYCPGFCGADGSHNCEGNLRAEIIALGRSIEASIAESLKSALHA